MQYTQDQLTEFWKHGDGYIDDPIDQHGRLVLHILKNEHKIQSMMVTTVDYELKKYGDHDSARSETAQATIIYSRASTQEDAWADWCVEEEIA